MPFLTPRRITWELAAVFVLAVVAFALLFHRVRSPGAKLAMAATPVLRRSDPTRPLLSRWVWLNGPPLRAAGLRGKVQRSPRTARSRCEAL